MKKHIYVLLALCLIPSTLFSMGGWRKKRADTTITLAEFQRRQTESDEKKRAEEARRKETQLEEQRLREEAERAAIARPYTCLQMDPTPAAAPAAPTEPTSSPETTESESDDDATPADQTAAPATTPNDATPVDNSSSSESEEASEDDDQATELNDVGALEPANESAAAASSAAATESPEEQTAVAVTEAGASPEGSVASASVVPSDETRAAVDALVAAAHVASAAAAAATPATEGPAADANQPYWNTLGIGERMAYSLSLSNVGTSLSSLARLTPQSSAEEKVYVSRSLTHAIEEINKKLETIALKYPNDDLHSLESRIAEEREQIKLLNVLISEAQKHDVEIINARMNIVVDRADDHKALCIKRTKLTKAADRDAAAFAKKLTRLALTRKTNKSDLPESYISDEDYTDMEAFDARVNR